MLEAQVVGSLTQFEGLFGKRLSYSILYDALDEFFSDGGVEAIIGRVVGPSAKTGELKLEDSGAATSLVVKARGPGEFSKAWKVKVYGTVEKFGLELVEGATVLEKSPEFTTQAAAVAWSLNSPYIIVTLGAGVLNPKAQEPTMSEGKDEHGAATDATWKNGLNLFTKEMGPGQVSHAGRTTAQGYIDQLAHAFANNRFALLDAPNSATASTLTAASLALRGTNDTYGMMLGRWPVIPGILPNVPREVPPSAVAAALIARSEANGNSPNKPAAANNGRSVRAISLATPPFEEGSLGIEVTRDEMYTKGINLFTMEGTVVDLYGWRTLTDPAGALQDWINAGNARLRMAIVAKAGAIAKYYVLDEVDGAGIVLHEFEGELKNMLAEYWPNKGLYGKTPEEAFLVNVGPTINTPASLANLEMKAEIGLRMSPDAEMVIILISKVPITQQLA